jgi:glycogen debranching enzyme
VGLQNLHQRAGEAAHGAVPAKQDSCHSPQVENDFFAIQEPVSRTAFHAERPLSMQTSDRAGDCVQRKDAPHTAAPAEDPFYIVADSPAADVHSRVLKQGESFLVCDRYGDIKRDGLGEEGLFHEGTRFLSVLLLLLGKSRPLLLSSTIQENNALLAVDLTNPDHCGNGDVLLPRGSVHLFRSRLLWESVCYECVRIQSYCTEPIRLSLAWRFAADYADIFEVRGTKRAAHGRKLEAEVLDREVVLGYVGLDGVVRRTRLLFSAEPAQLGPTTARFDLELEPHEEATLYLSASCEIGERIVEPVSYEEAVDEVTQSLSEHGCRIEASNERFNGWLHRSSADLKMMVSQTSQGPYPYAGVPWFSTPFGRDGLLTAWQCLWLEPDMARGVLGYLALTQAHTSNAEQDAEPGKILHETRGGEMAALKEVPFGRYYGSIDSTPLFVMLAYDYHQRTGDLDFIRQLWPNLELALKWIDVYGDRDGDGFVEYARHSPQGLLQQGWKDSHDSIFHQDGREAEGPIALCEVQGYVYAAKRGAAHLAALLGNAPLAGELARQAEALREQFEQAFWCEEINTYAIALDGHKRRCQVRNSNAGHCLMTGIASDAHARRAGATLLDQRSFTGWGVRTIAAGESRYNPMSYHNGSVWPHDNAIIASGLARYGMKSETVRIFDGLFATSQFVDLHRMPELFCGFDRRPGEGPTLYPVACAPQSWAAAAVFSLLQSCIGLEIDAPRAEVSLRYPVLPKSLREVRIQNLTVGSATLDLLLQRHDLDVGVNVLRREGQVEVLVVK